jgi:hypothetical protein
MQDQDLSLVSVDDLMKELHKRFDAFIFSGIQVRNPGKIVTVRKWSGLSSTCAGLASQLQVVIYDRHQESEDSDDEPFED